MKNSTIMESKKVERIMKESGWLYLSVVVIDLIILAILITNL
ncbi:MAG: hypothetical protein NWQ55_09520 [Salibacteraceae bacterium]|nr:hypothetical protein [Salibacteraceae bacterium]MDP4686580.1 hypothetical protein [Salibacteraceae bacterium]MDP4764214.1 hypothetical protein [Salibacteraceae bacterium]MDP4843268.1 hypothetical protein [Salibacteraceae bacterium]MDP4933899.1 hypothetical protein [Salibacteraceae bacterium]